MQQPYSLSVRLLFSASFRIEGRNESKMPLPLDYRMVQSVASAFAEQKHLHEVAWSRFRVWEIRSSGGFRTLGMFVKLR